jgi:hypothetical protein
MALAIISGLSLWSRRFIHSPVHVVLFQRDTYIYADTLLFSDQHRSTVAS